MQREVGVLAVGVVAGLIVGWSLGSQGRGGPEGAPLQVSREHIPLRPGLLRRQPNVQLPLLAPVTGAPAAPAAQPDLAAENAELKLELEQAKAKLDAAIQSR